MWPPPLKAAFPPALPRRQVYRDILALIALDAAVLDVILALLLNVVSVVFWVAAPATAIESSSAAAVAAAAWMCAHVNEVWCCAAIFVCVKNVCVCVCVCACV